MALITVLAPDYEASRVETVELAPREAIEPGAVLTIIENGKPRAKQILTLLAEALRAHLPLAHIVVHSKPGAGQPISPDEARAIAARSRLVLTGLGD